MRTTKSLRLCGRSSASARGARARLARALEQGAELRPLVLVEAGEDGKVERLIVDLGRQRRGAVTHVVHPDVDGLAHALGLPQVVLAELLADVRVHLDRRRGARRHLGDALGGVLGHRGQARTGGHEDLYPAADALEDLAPSRAAVGARPRTRMMRRRSLRVTDRAKICSRAGRGAAGRRCGGRSRRRPEPWPRRTVWYWSRRGGGGVEEGRKERLRAAQGEIGGLRPA